MCLFWTMSVIIKFRPKKRSEKLFFRMKKMNKSLILIADLFWSPKLRIFLDFSSKNHKKQQKTTKSEKFEKMEFSQTYMIMVPKCSLQSVVYFCIKIFSIYMEKTSKKWIFLKLEIFELNREHIEEILFFHQKTIRFDSEPFIQG